MPPTGRGALLSWVQTHTSPNCVVENFKSASWRDGVVLCTLLSSIWPKSIDLTTLAPLVPEKRLEMALKVIEEHGIPKILEPNEFDSPELESSLVMLISQLYQSVKSKKPVSARLSKQQMRQSQLISHIQYCAKCNNPLSHINVECNKKHYHTDCFICTLCECKLTTSCVIVGGNAYCNPCGQKSFKMATWKLHKKDKERWWLELWRNSNQVFPGLTKDGASLHSSGDDSTEDTGTELDDDLFYSDDDDEDEDNPNPTLKASPKVPPASARPPPPSIQPDDIILEQIQDEQEKQAFIDLYARLPDPEPLAIQLSLTEVPVSSSPLVGQPARKSLNQPSSGSSLSINSTATSATDKSNRKSRAHRSAMLIPSAVIADSEVSNNNNAAPSPAPTPTPTSPTASSSKSPPVPPAKSAKSPPIRSPASAKSPPVSPRNGTSTTTTKSPPVSPRDAKPAPTSPTTNNSPVPPRPARPAPSSLPGKSPATPKAKAPARPLPRNPLPNLPSSSQSPPVSPRDGSSTSSDSPKEEVHSPPTSPGSDDPPPSPGSSIPQLSTRAIGAPSLPTSTSMDDISSSSSTTAPPTYEGNSTRDSNNSNYSTVSMDNSEPNTPNGTARSRFSRMFAASVSKLLTASDSDGPQEPPIREGFLVKKSDLGIAGFVKPWQRRYFLLRRDQLLYFVNKECRMKGLILGIIPLNSVVQIVPIAPAKYSRFQLLGENGMNWFLQAANRQEMIMWLQALRKAGNVRNEEKLNHLSKVAGLTLNSLQKKEGEVLVRHKTTFVSRWIVLKDGILWEYSSKDGPLKAKIALYKCQLNEYQAPSGIIGQFIDQFGQNPNDKTYSFQITSPTRSTIIRTQSAEQMHGWLNAILKQKVIVEEIIENIAMEPEA